MSITAASLTDGIKVDQVTQKGSVNDVIALVLSTKTRNAWQTMRRLAIDNPDLHARCMQLRINGKGRETPVADAATLVEIAWLLPGRAAGAFRRKGAESVCRMLGGDLSLVDETQRRHAQVAGTAEEEFLLADAQGGDSAQQTVSHKRGLDDDDEVYAAKKQQVLRQIRQEAAGTELAIIKQHAQGSMSILVCSSCMVAGGALPADSMIENGMQSMLAIEAQKQQQELSINQQAQRWTVQMYANKLGLPAAACTADKLRAVGAAAGKIWTRERCLPTIERSQDGALVRVWFEPGSNTAQKGTYIYALCVKNVLLRKSIKSCLLQHCM